MDAGDLEGLAEAAYREAGAEPDEAESPATLARLLLGPGSVEVVSSAALRFRSAKLARVGDDWRIFVRSAAPEVMRFAVAHELAHWLLRRAGVPVDDQEEADADQLGACVVAPRRAFLRALRALGHDLPELAEAFTTTESLAALRFGETTSTPLALVRPGLVRVRSQLEFVWPDAETIAGWARGTPPRGLAKTKLTDDRRRVVLVGNGCE